MIKDKIIVQRVVELNVGFLDNPNPKFYKILDSYDSYYIVVKDFNKEIEKLKNFISMLHHKNKKVILTIRGDKTLWGQFVIRDNKKKDHKITNFVKTVDEFLKYHNFDGIEIYWKGLTIFNYKKWRYFIKFMRDHFQFTKRRFYFESPFIRLFKKLVKKIPNSDKKN